MSRKLQRRRVTRGTRPTFLVVTNGQATETEYLNELRRRVGSQVSVKVHTVGRADPARTVRKITAPAFDRGEYDQVWVVIDKDGNDLDEFFKLCRSAKLCGVVSNPCFEVWLAAHYGAVPRYQDQADAQRHYLRLSGQRSESKKHLPSHFPWDRVGEAMGAVLIGRSYP